MGQTIGVVDVLIPGQAPEHRLAQQSGQQVPGVPATATFRQRRTGEIGQPERVVEFAVGEQSGVRRDAAALELEPEAAVEIDPESAIIRFTRWVFHPRVLNLSITR